MGFFALLLLIVVVAISVDRLKQSQDTRNEASESAEQIPKKMGVLEIAYFPPDSNDPTRLSQQITGSSPTLISIAKEHIARRSEFLRSKLNLASKYHGYTTTQAQPFADPNAQQFLDYQTIQKFEYEKPIPASNFRAWGKPDTYRPDYRQMLTDINICDYVDNQNDSERVRQVWLWGYHTDAIEPDESNMSMGRLIQPYWSNSAYGDISNSQRIDDLPTCDHTYVLYNFAPLYSGVSDLSGVSGYALEDHAHQIEHIIEWLDIPNGNDLWWKNFVGSNAKPDHSIRRPGCGWTHLTPNSIPEDGDDYNSYKWYFENSRDSDCMDWKPDGTGQKTAVSCHTWAGDSCNDDTGTAYKVWWMQSLPGYNNNLSYDTPTGIRVLTNWWEATYDLDRYLQMYGRSLSKTIDPANPITVTPSPTTAPSPTPVSSPVPTPGTIDLDIFGILEREYTVTTPIQYQLTVRNQGTTTAHQVQLSLNTASSGVQVVAAIGNNICTNLPIPENDTERIRQINQCIIGDLTSGQELVIPISVLHAQPGNLAITHLVTSIVNSSIELNIHNNSVTLNTTVIPAATPEPTPTATPNPTAVPSPFHTADIYPIGNPDRKVDMDDYRLLATNFNKRSTDSNWEPAADIVQDGWIDLSDYAELVRQFSPTGY